MNIHRDSPPFFNGWSNEVIQVEFKLGPDNNGRLYAATFSTSHQRWDYFITGVMSLYRVIKDFNTTGIVIEVSPNFINSRYMYYGSDEWTFNSPKNGLFGLTLYESQGEAVMESSKENLWNVLVSLRDIVWEENEFGSFPKGAYVSMNSTRLSITPAYEIH